MQLSCAQGLPLCLCLNIAGLAARHRAFTFPPAIARGRTWLHCRAETDDSYNDDASSEVSLEVGAEAGADFEAQQRLHAASVAQSGPATATGEPAAVAPHQSMLRRFSKDHAISEGIQKRFMIAVENDEKAAKTRVQDWLVSPPLASPHSDPKGGFLQSPSCLCCAAQLYMLCTFLLHTQACNPRDPHTDPLLERRCASSQWTALAHIY